MALAVLRLATGEAIREPLFRPLSTFCRSSPPWGEGGEIGRASLRRAAAPKTTGKSIA